MAEATEQLRIVITAQDQASAVIRNVGSEMTSLAGNLVRGAAQGVGFAAFNQAMQAIGNTFQFASDAVIGFNSTLEQSRIGWTTMLGSAQQADVMLERLRNFAATTPFEFQDVERGARRFAAMGFSAGEILPLMKSVGEAAAAVGGGSADSFNRIGLALGQMQTRMKVTAEDMMQLTEVGVPAWKILADATGTSVAQIQDAVTKGQVSSDVMIQAFMRFTDLHWKDLLDPNTFAAAVSNIHDSAQFLISQAFQPLFGGLRDLANAFANWLTSDDAKRLGDSVRNAQIAVSTFLNVVSSSDPILNTFKGALAGVATLLGVQFVVAAARATASLIPLAAAFVLANAPLVALAAAAATAGVLIAANWNQISENTADLRDNIVSGLGGLASWLGDTFWPALINEWTTGWNSLGTIAIQALNAFGEAWNTFWGQEILPSQGSALDNLNAIAAEGWTRWIDISTGALRFFLERWNVFIGQLGALRDVLPREVPLPNGLDILVGKFADIDKITASYQDFLKQAPSLAGNAFSGVGTFFHDVLPVAIKNAVDMVQQGVTDLAGLPDAVLKNIQAATTQVGDTGLDVGRQIGSNIGTGIVQGVKPLLEELANLIAKQAAAPATAALEDTQSTIERDRLLLQIRGLPGEARAAARRQIRDLERNVLPQQKLEAFDVGRDVTLTQRILDTVNLKNRIDEIERLLTGQTLAGGPALATATLGTGMAAPTITPPAPTQIFLRLDVTSDGGDPTTIYQELIEANGQAVIPPVIQLSGTRRN